MRSDPVVSTVFGGRGSCGHVDGMPSTAILNLPAGLTSSADRTSLFFCELGSHRIREYCRVAGKVRTCAGSGCGFQDGPVSSARFAFPHDLALCGSRNENLVIADTGNDAIRLLNIPSGVVSTVVRGRGGPKSNVSIQEPLGCCSAKGNILAFVSDAMRVYAIERGSTRPRLRVRVVAGGSWGDGSGSGGAPQAGYRDGSYRQALFNRPCGLALDAIREVLYVCDSKNHCVRAVDMSGRRVKTVAGTPSECAYRDGSFKDARFKFPQRIVFDSEQSLLYVTDLSDCVRVLNLAEQRVTTLVGSGERGLQDGLASSAQFDLAMGLCLDERLGALYLCDSANHALRCIWLSGRDATEVSPRNFRTLFSENVRAAMNGGSSGSSRTSLPSILKRGGGMRLAAWSPYLPGGFEDGLNNDLFGEGGVAGDRSAYSVHFRDNLQRLLEEARTRLSHVHPSVLRSHYFQAHPPDLMLSLCRAIAVLVHEPRPATMKEGCELIARSDLQRLMAAVDVERMGSSELCQLRAHLQHALNNDFHHLPDLQPLVKWLETSEKAAAYWVEHHPLNRGGSTTESSLATENDGRLFHRDIRITSQTPERTHGDESTTDCKDEVERLRRENERLVTLLRESRIEVAGLLDALDLVLNPAVPITLGSDGTADGQDNDR